MLDGNVEQKLCQLQEACIYKTGRGNRNCNAHKQSKMMLCQFASQEIPDPGSCKSAEHLNRTASQQKCKSTTCKCRCQSEFYRRIEFMDLLDFIQPLMDFFSGQMRFLRWKTIYKLFHPIKLGSIYSGICNTKRL